MSDGRGVKVGPFGPISKNVSDGRGANDALIVRFEDFTIFCSVNLAVFNANPKNDGFK